VCISWTIKCLILLMHGATMKFKWYSGFIWFCLNVQWYFVYNFWTNFGLLPWLITSATNHCNFKYFKTTLLSTIRQNQCLSTALVMPYWILRYRKKKAVSSEGLRNMWQQIHVQHLPGRTEKNHINCHSA